MYEAMRSGFSLPHISNHVYGTSRDFRSYTRDRQAEIPQRKTPIFRFNEALDFESIGILGLLHRTKSENLFVILIKDRFSS